MARQYSLVCEDDIGERVRALAREYGLTEEEVLRQLIQRGLEQTEAERRS
ncbi:CopG family transcriptional regulator [Halostella sp. JP-L12]|nr:MULTISPECIES: CopG family transcriptional regulator [Halostella]NHN46940.1 CopG family transcriptional regulator [Halostella sp. JP-L12]